MRSYALVALLAGAAFATPVPQDIDWDADPATMAQGATDADGAPEEESEDEEDGPTFGDPDAPSEDEDEDLEEGFHLR